MDRTMVQRMMDRWLALSMASCVVVLGGCNSSVDRVVTAPLQVPLSKAVQAPDGVARDAHEDAESVEGRSTQYFGAVTRAAVVPQASGAALDYAANGVELNFQSTDVRQVVDAVLGNILERDYVIDPGVQGQVTLRTGRPITLDSVLPALEAVLNETGAILLDRAGRLEIRPRNTLNAALVPVRGPQAPGRVRPPGYALEIYPLTYSLPTQVEQLLQPLVGPQSIIQVSDRFGHMIIAGTADERRNIARLIETFDVDWLADRAFAIYELRYLRPDDVIGQIQEIMGEERTNNAQLQLVPLPRMKAVLGVASDRRQLRQIDDWIARFDVPPRSGERRLFVYQVKNVDAVQLGQALQQIMAPGGVPLTPALDSAANALTASSFGGGTRVQQAGASAPETTNLAQLDDARVLPSAHANALMIYATPEEFARLEDALIVMDVFARQVMIEAVLAEVRLDDDFDLGLQWSYSDSDISVVLSEADMGGVASSFPGFSVLYSGDANVRAVLNAIASVTDVKVLSSPKLLVLNNQTATLQVGDQVPVVTQQSQGTIDGNAPVINNVELRDTGVILEVTPRISDSGMVFIEINQEVSDVVATTTSGIDSPTIQQRQITTTVGVEDGSTIALGGLIRESVSRGRSGVPFLKDVPIAGRLFGATSRNTRRTELVILLTPQVLRDGASAERMTERLIEDFEGMEIKPTAATPGS